MTAAMEDTASRSRTEITAYAGVAASVLSLVLLLATPWHWSLLLGAFVLACVPAGAGVMCWIDGGADFVQASLTLVLSLAAFALGSVTMIWLAAWHPRALLALAGLGLASCLARLVHRWRR